MSLFAKKIVDKKDKKAVETALAPVYNIDRNLKGLAFITELVNRIRPKKPNDIASANLNFKAVLYELQNNKSFLFAFRKSLLNEFLISNIDNALTECGITSSRSFIQELSSKIKHKILPVLHQKDNFLYTINEIFYKKTDHIWVENIEEDLWIKFFQLLGINVNLANEKLIVQIHTAMQILSLRIASLGIEKEILYDKNLYPTINQTFIDQSIIVNKYLEQFSQEKNKEKLITFIINLEETLYNCKQSILWIKENRKLKGTSLAQTFIITRLEEQINRLLIICDILDSNNTFNTERFLGYFKTVIKYEKQKNSLRAFLSSNTGYLAYQIAEHGGRTGEKFITNTKREFWQMFFSATKGGLIISFIAILKTFISNIPNLIPFWRGILYSGNYSLGFILIQETNATLATKQPAYTANNLAESFDTEKFKTVPDLRNVAITIGKVSRTQLVSFVGNLIIVFPLTFILSFLFEYLTGQNIVLDATAYKMLLEQHPLKSGSLIFAAFTGLFLFLSGLIAGYTENHLVYGDIPKRLKNLPSFKLSFNKKWQDKIVHYVQNNFGALIGNISLGFFLGLAGFIGKTFGLPFLDIRHITISAANSAIAFEHLGTSIGWSLFLTTILGVFLIGFINFAVSFGLAFYVAVKSRNIHLKDYPEFLGVLWKYFKKFPQDFIKAPSVKREIEML